VEDSENIYDEEQWKTTVAEADSSFPADREEPFDSTDEAAPDGPPPRLEELLPRISPRNRELLEGLFRGRFVAVERLNRKKLH
jgi:hypothetical protein